MQGKRFRYLYSRMGLKPADVAKLLHVSERTVHNWVAGSVRVPYAAYKLLKLQLHYELPGKAWEGWSFSAGKLYTPEGYSLHPSDWSWWSLLARRAAMFGPLYRENGLLKVKLSQSNQEAARQALAGTPPNEADGRACRRQARGAGAAGLDLSLGHFGTSPAKAVGSQSEKQPGAPLVGAGGMGVQNPHDNPGQPTAAATKSGVSARHRLNRFIGSRQA